MKKFVCSTILSINNGCVEKLEILNNNIDSDVNITDINTTLNTALQMISQYNMNCKAIESNDVKLYYDEKIKTLEQIITDNENKYKKDINDIKEKLEQTHIDKMNHLVSMKDNQIEIMTTQINNMKNIEQTIRKECNDNMLLKLECKDEKINSLNDIIQNHNNEKETLKRDLEKNHNKLIETIENNHKIYVEQMKEQMDIDGKLTSLTETLQPKRKSNIELGEDGEMMAYNILHKHYEFNQNVDYKRCQTETGTGDIELTMRIKGNTFKCCIDTKNKPSGNQINSTEIDKMKRDVDLFKNNYACGMLIAIGNNPFYGDVQNFDIIYTKDKKPIICINDIENYPNYIPIAISVLTRELLKEENDVDEQFGIYNSILSKQLKNVNSSKKTIMSMKKSIDSLNKQRETLEKNLDNQMKSLATIEIHDDNTCVKCGKIFNSKKNLENHIKNNKCKAK